MSKIYTGTRITISLDTRVDLSGYGELKIRYKKPSGVVGEWAAQLSYFSNVSYSVSNTSILNESGDWRLQVYVKLGGKEYLSSTVIMTIYDIFK